jgi:endoglucanase
MRTLFAAFLAGWALLGFAGGQTMDRSITPEPNTAYASYGETSLGNIHGVNLGNMLEAPKEGDWGEKVEEDYFPIIRQAGFTIIRIPIRWSAHVGPAPDYTIDPAFFSRVDWVVAQAEKNGFLAILDYHNDDALMKEPDANADRFIAIWKQIAEHYQNAPSLIFFELLNEPNDKLDAPKWNDLLAQTLKVVRVTNPTRMIVVGPVAWNGIWALPKLVLPESDRNLLVTVHFYDPMTFTHQGASWIEGSDKWLGNTWQGTDAEKQVVTQAFDQAGAWGKAHDRPIYLGEFGSYSRGDTASRARWTAFVARTAESHGFPWTYWEFCSGFGVYDPQAHQWRQPLLDALIPKR